MNLSYSVSQESQCKDPLFKETAQKLADILESACLYYTTMKKGFEQQTKQLSKVRSDKALIKENPEKKQRNLSPFDKDSFNAAMNNLKAEYQVLFV